MFSFCWSSYSTAAVCIFEASVSRIKERLKSGNWRIRCLKNFCLRVITLLLFSVEDSSNLSGCVSLAKLDSEAAISAKFSINLWSIQILLNWEIVFLAFCRQETLSIWVYWLLLGTFLIQIFQLYNLQMAVLQLQSDILTTSVSYWLLGLG